VGSRCIDSNRRPFIQLRSAGDNQQKGAPDLSKLAAFIASIRHPDEDGQGLAEYALILALIAIIAIVALIFLGGQVSTILSTVGASI
jgi:pilus assembly protein Flp/PilA